MQADFATQADAAPVPFAAGHVRHNFIVNLADGGFFGFALGVASFVTVLPLFVAQMTDSTVLIGLIGALHNIGWQLPQLFTANYVARLRRYKRMVVMMTIHERWPYFALAGLALALPILPNNLALVLTFILVIWQAFGGGFTATAWQSMIAKLMPGTIRGLFYGTQSGLANLLSSAGAVIAGAILVGVAAPNNFALCFLLAAIAMVISGSFLAATREDESPPAPDAPSPGMRAFVANLAYILRTDANFRWFIVARSIMQFAALGTAFYTIYATRRFEMDGVTAGIMTAVLMISQTVASPLMGRIGDRYGNRLVFIIGGTVFLAGSLLAWAAPSLTWFYFVFALAGVGGAASWAPTNAIVADFGAERQRAFYIGLTNTLIAPFTLIAPILGGAMADAFSFEATFAFSAVGSILTTVLFVLAFRDPRFMRRTSDVHQAGG